MNSAPYTPIEDAILVKHWSHGFSAAANALNAAGCAPRTRNSIRSRIGKLRHAGHAIPFASSGRRGATTSTWSQAELAILMREYPLHGSEGARAALTRAGHQDRSMEAIQGRVKRARRDGDSGSIGVTVIERITAALTRYQGMPLTIQDLHYELGVSRGALRRTLNALVTQARAASWDGPDGIVYKLTEAPA